MRALAFFFALAAPLVAQPPTIPQPSSTLRTLLESPGGPLKVLEWEAGRIDESSSSDTTNSARPFALIYAERVQITNAPVRGIRLALYGAAVDEHKRTNIFDAYLAEDEVASLLQSIREGQALQPLNDPHPGARIYVQWQSADGLIFTAVSKRAGGAVVFNLSTATAGGPSMSLSRTQIDSFANLITSAMNDSSSAMN